MQHQINRQQKFKKSVYYNKIPALVWDKNMNIYICKNRFQEDIVTVHTEVFDITGTSK